jgi:hypothetical protein
MWYTDFSMKLHYLYEFSNELFKMIWLYLSSIVICGQNSVLVTVLLSKMKGVR